MTAIIDYGVGNLFSLLSSFKKIGEEAVVTKDPETLRKADRIILPGVGAYRDAINKLRESGLVPVLTEQIEAGKPVMGICLGMQLLFDKSFEYGEYEGLGLIKGNIIPIDSKDGKLKVPHMGWNSLYIHMDNPLFKYVKNGEYVYFVHSYYAKTDPKYIIADTQYGVYLTAAVAKGNVFGCQFHPEKSSDTGLNILRGFCEL